MSTGSAALARGYVAMKSFVMKSCLLLSVGAAGMKLQEPADCVGDLIGAFDNGSTSREWECVD